MAAQGRSIHCTRRTGCPHAAHWTGVVLPSTLGLSLSGKDTETLGGDDAGETVTASDDPEMRSAGDMVTTADDSEMVSPSDTATAVDDPEMVSPGDMATAADDAQGDKATASDNPEMVSPGDTATASDDPEMVSPVQHNKGSGSTIIEDSHVLGTAESFCFTILHVNPTVRGRRGGHPADPVRLEWSPPTAWDE